MVATRAGYVATQAAVTEAAILWSGAAGWQKGRRGCLRARCAQRRLPN